MKILHNKMFVCEDQYFLWRYDNDQDAITVLDY